MDTPILSIKGLNAYYGSVPALEQINVTINPASIVTIVGPNGAGKSTLLGSIMGSLPPPGRATGEITFQNTDISSYTIGQRVRRGVCLVPEKRELFGSMSVEENLRLGGFIHRKNSSINSEHNLLEVFDLFPRLHERKKQQAQTLSGGERQMLALGRALMAKPQLLLLDEPSLGLAPLVVSEIFQIIENLRASGVAILLVEQNARAALKVADYAYVLETGAVALEGTGVELSSDPRVAAMYLGQSNAHALTD